MQVDLTEINHSPVARPASPSAGHQVITALNEHIVTLQTEVLDMKAIAGGHRADFERETDRSNGLMAELNKLMAEVMKASNEATAAREKAAYYAGKLATAERSLAKKRFWRQPKPIAPSSSGYSEKHRPHPSIPISAAALIMVTLLSWSVVAGLNHYLGPVEQSPIVTGSVLR